jgi:putative ABC transport system substrate-binding protein
MSNRRELIVAFGAGALVAPFGLFAQSPGRIPQIGLLWIETDSSSQNVVAFRDGLRTHGYLEGKNIRVDDRSLVDRYELLHEAAARLVAENVDVIVCFGSSALQAASKATSTIPIVMVLSGDPVKFGVAASLSRPGRNVTGTSSITQELSGKRLELLKEIAPALRRFAVILYPGSASEVASLKSYAAAARQLNLEVHPVEVRTPEEIPIVVGGIARMNVQAIAVVGSTLLRANSKRIVAAIEKVRLPAIYPYSDFPISGGLMSYGPNYLDGFRRAATYVDKILKGAKPGDIPIEQPTNFELVINMRTAKLLGIKIPDSIKLQATRVIE